MPTSWFHPRYEYDDRRRCNYLLSHAIIGRELPTQHAPELGWPKDGPSLSFLRLEDLRQSKVFDDPEEDGYYGADGDPVDDNLARFFRDTRAELEASGLLEGRELRIYLL